MGLLEHHPGSPRCCHHQGVAVAVVVALNADGGDARDCGHAHSALAGLAVGAFLVVDPVAVAAAVAGD